MTAPAETARQLTAAIDAALQGGREIMAVYESDFAVEHKEDRSPLTLADKNAHHHITALLAATRLPVLSEEGRDIPYEERKSWERFWLVDPLDGTKEFVKRNGEFTVNIALVSDGLPVMGVIYAPVKQWLYFAAEEIGSYKFLPTADCQLSTGGIDAIIKSAKRLPIKNSRSAYTVVASRSHKSPETEAFIGQLKQEHGKIETVSMGSSLKICLVAEGAADIYPRFGPTMEWDTAAGQAIAAFAGRQVTDWKTQKTMRYNKANLLNNWFVVQ